MFIRNAWYVAAWADEIGDAPLARRICNEPVVLFRDKEGHAAALLDICCHRGAPLHMGMVIEEGLQCGYHGLVFDRSGACVHVPGQTHILERTRVPWWSRTPSSGSGWATRQRQIPPPSCPGRITTTR
jgi:phenylpropionate dioxygenase-like ring-hydroxylating dioxygenase large terminal subunit